MYCRKWLPRWLRFIEDDSSTRVVFGKSITQSACSSKGRGGGTKTDRRPTMWEFFGLSWERDNYDSN
jgi:hypothetical protein